MEYHKCRKCQKTYEEREFHKHSIKPDNYLKANLGICSTKCWNTLSSSAKAHEKMILGLYGKIRKDHKFPIQ